jgi:Holliday junction resolvase-like predicted endonuclease
VPKSKKLPPAVINTWPEIFGEIEIDVVPIEYLHSINVKFKDGKIWEIDVKKSREKKNINIESALEELFEQYEDAIDSIDFRLDTEKVKYDIKKRTASFMKKRK